MGGKLIYIKYMISIFLALVLSFLCGFQMVLFPFFTALISALLCAGHKWYIVDVLTIAVLLLFGENVYNGASIVFLLLIMSVVSILLGKKVYIKEWVLGVLFLLSNAFIIFNFAYSEQYVEGVIFLLVSVTSFFIFKIFLTNIQNQPFLFRHSKTSLSCLCFLCIVFAGGLSQIYVPYINAYLLVGMFLVFVTSRIMNASWSTIFSVVYGLGATITTSEVFYIPLFVLSAIVCNMLESKLGVYEICGVLIVQAVLSLYFNSVPNFNVFSLVQTLIAGIVFLCVPKKVLTEAKMFCINNNTEFTTRDLNNRNRGLIKTKLLYLSNVFFDLDVEFKKMLTNELPINEAKQLLIQDVKKNICANCTHRLVCEHSNSKVQEEINLLFDIAFEKGKITLLDISPNMANGCHKTPQILININKLTSQYKQYLSMMKNLDNSKLLIADQLHGVAQIMKNLSQGFDEKIETDNVLEQKIIQKLQQNNITCSEAVVFKKGESVSSCALLIKNDDGIDFAIEKIVSEESNCGLKIADKTLSESSGWTSFVLEVKNKYNVVCGVATACKNGLNVSGDCFSISPLNNNKFLIAISDGMGHGEKAKQNSELTINVVENFYKAGFDNEIVLSSVNKLMNINQMEDFSTLDLCVLDLDFGFIDFIKMGASATYLKHKNCTDVIEGSSLPLGIVDKLEICVKKSAVQEDDYIILCSDGVADCFGGEEHLYTYINHMCTTSPQECANLINKEAQTRSKGCLKDDCTVLVAKIIR